MKAKFFFLAKATLIVEISSKVNHAETCLLSQSVECVMWNHERPSKRRPQGIM